jgi:hypothetical protein
MRRTRLAGRSRMRHARALGAVPIGRGRIAFSRRLVFMMGEVNGFSRCPSVLNL